MQIGWVERGDEKVRGGQWGRVEMESEAEVQIGPAVREPVRRSRQGQQVQIGSAKKVLCQG